LSNEDLNQAITPVTSPAPPSGTPWWSTPGASGGDKSFYSASTVAPATADSEITNDSRGSNYSKQRPSVGLGVAVVMALLAGIVGSVIGRAANLGGGNANLVSLHSSIERAPDSIAAIAARVSPSVVSVSVQTSSGGDSGSGFFVRSDGYILTNNHVIEAGVNNGDISVNLANGKSYPAKIVGRDTAYDLAILKIAVTNAPALQLGNSDEVQVGDSVVAIGSPLGLSGTVTSGIISAKDRAVTAGAGAGTGTGESSFINALQTDAAINPGNSGGPLVNAAGAVIGVNSAIASLGSSFAGQSGSIGLGFAIPINQAKKTADQLISTGFSTYPIIGLSLDSRFTGIGAKVAMAANAILTGGPAQRAGIKPGDVIVAIDGKVISNSDELIVAVRSHNVGDKVRLKFLRGTATKEVSLTLIAKK
jgi:putative serine protease PepD